MAIPVRPLLALTLTLTGTLLGQEQPPNYIQMHPLLKALDANNDGLVSTSELSRAPQALRELDKNKDGVLSTDEMRPAGRPPGVPGEGRPPETSELVSMLMSFDANRDGKLTKSEVPERLQGLFNRADTDNDGVLTTGELTKLAEAQQQAGQADEPRGRGGSGGPGEGVGGPRSGRGMRMDAITRALDTNGDGLIDGNEIRDSVSSLQTLDLNKDGKLTEDEVRPMRRPDGGRPK